MGIYLLNLFLAFLTPKFDPSLEQDDEMEGGGLPALPTKQDEEFRPFIRRLPEFKFWHNATRAITLSIFATLFAACDIPGLCSRLAVRAGLTSGLCVRILSFLARACCLLDHPLHPDHEEADPTHDQIPLCSVYFWQDSLHPVVVHLRIGWWFWASECHDPNRRWDKTGMKPTA